MGDIGICSLFDSDPNKRSKKDGILLKVTILGLYRDVPPEISPQVEYEDIPFFRKVFVKLTGLRPKEYQQRFAGYPGIRGHNDNEDYRILEIEGNVF